MTLRTSVWMAVLVALPISVASANGSGIQQNPAAATVALPSCTAPPIPPGQPWTLEYSWGGGMGTGSVDLSLSSDGKAVLTSTPNQGKPTVRNLKIPADSMAKIVEVLSNSQPECVHTILRKGYIVFDLGRYSLKFTSGATSVSAYIDECHVVDDVERFKAIVDVIYDLKPLLGDDITWGPFATTSAPGNGCDGK